MLGNTWLPKHINIYSSFYQGMTQTHVRGLRSHSMQRSPGAVERQKKKNQVILIYMPISFPATQGDFYLCSMLCGHWLPSL